MKQDWWILPTVHAVLSALRSLASKVPEIYVVFVIHLITFSIRQTRSRKIPQML